MARVGIVICNYNKAELVLLCIKSVLENKYEDYDLYIVDNGSTDSSVARIRDAYIGKSYGNRNVVLIENKENLGGSVGFDTGLYEAAKHGYEYYMCIDNDALLDENAIGELVNFLDTHKECGIAASKIYHMENPDYVQNFGQKIDFDYFCTEVEYYNRLEDGSMPEFTYTDSVPACSLMVRAKVCGKIGFLPEKNFLYWDDTEWCYLCNKAGYKVASVGASQALHKMGAKQEYLNTFPTYYAYRNWISFFLRYTPSDNRDKMAESILGSVFQAQFEGKWKGEYKAPLTIYSAYDDAIHGVAGKAGPDRIFDVDVNKDNYAAMFKGRKNMAVIENSYPAFTETLIEKAGEYGCSLQLITDSESLNYKGPRIYICESIFHAGLDHEICTELHNDFIADISDCYVQINAYEKMMEMYNSEKEMFMFTQKPLVLRQAEILAGK